MQHMHVPSACLSVCMSVCLSVSYLSVYLLPDCARVSLFRLCACACACVYVREDACVGVYHMGRHQRNVVKRAEPSLWQDGGVRLSLWRSTCSVCLHWVCNMTKSACNVYSQDCSARRSKRDYDDAMDEVSCLPSSSLCGWM